jgi:outer membrane protein assembly factor BamB
MNLVTKLERVGRTPIDCRVPAFTLALLLMFFPSDFSQAQSMFRGDPAHSGVYAGQGPRQFHRLKWKFATGNRIVSSPVIDNKKIYFGSDDGNIYAIDAKSGREIWKRSTRGPVPSTPAVSAGTVYLTSYDGNFYALNAETGALKWKFATGGERRFEAKGLHGMQPKNQTIADPFDIYLSSPVVADGAVYFGSGDGNLYALDAASGDLRWKFKTGDVVHASPAFVNGVVFVGSWDSYFYAVDAKTGKERWRFHGGEDPLIHNQVGFQSSPAVIDGTVYTGCRDAQVYALDAATGKEKWRFDNALSWVNTSPAVTKGKVFFATSDSSLYHMVDAATGKSIVRQQGKAYMFSSPAITGDVAFIGVLNGTLEARDPNTGEFLWDYQTDASKQNNGWVLTADRRFNQPLLFFDNWGEAPILAQDRQISVGSIFSSPLVANGVVYFGSTDGFLYALE